MKTKQTNSGKDVKLSRLRKKLARLHAGGYQKPQSGDSTFEAVKDLLEKFATSRSDLFVGVQVGWDEYYDKWWLRGTVLMAALESALGVDIRGSMTTSFTLSDEDPENLIERCEERLELIRSFDKRAAQALLVGN